MIDIKIKKRDNCAITSINASKCLIYQVILIVIRGFVLVILPIIAHIED